MSDDPNLIALIQEAPLIVTDPDGSQWVALEDYLKIARYIDKRRQDYIDKRIDELHK